MSRAAYFKNLDDWGGPHFGALGDYITFVLLPTGGLTVEGGRPVFYSPDRLFQSFTCCPVQLNSKPDITLCGVQIFAREYYQDAGRRQWGRALVFSWGAGDDFYVPSGTVWWASAPGLADLHPVFPVP